VTVLRYLVLLAFVVALMLMVVEKRNALTEEGYRMAKLHNDVRRLGERVERLRILYQRLTSAALLRSRVRELELPLVPAAPSVETGMEDEASD